MAKLFELKSPFEAWPGSIFVPETIDSTDFNVWWEEFNRIEDGVDAGEDSRHSVLTTWESRFHFIKRHTMKLGKDLKKRPYEIEPTGLQLPSVRIARWFIQETQVILDLEMNLKNLPGPSTTTKSTNL